MNKDKKNLAFLISGMKKEYNKGKNVMAWARSRSKVKDSTQITLIAYDLQAGTYVKFAEKNILLQKAWGNQLAELLNPFLSKGDKILEVGVGEGTTLTEVLNAINVQKIEAYGFDLSWSRIETGNQWLIENNCIARLFVADLMKIPLEDNSVDVVYSSHSLEPNRGKEETAIKECLRVARRCVVLFEPFYELAPPEAQARMRRHGYVEGLRKTAERLGAEIKDYRLLNYSPNPLNPSGVLHLNKKRTLSSKNLNMNAPIWRCPITNAKLKPRTHYYYNPTAGLAYPVIKGIPMLRAEHAIVASKIENKQKSCIKKIK